MRNKTLPQAQNRYKRAWHIRVRFAPISFQDDYFFVERFLVSTTATKRLATENRSKTQFHLLRTYRKVSVRPKFYHIIQNYIKNTSSSNPLTPTSHSNGNRKKNWEPGSKNENLQAKQSVLAALPYQEAQGYSVNHIVHLVDTPEGTHYVV